MGRSSSGLVLPHAQVHIQNEQGKILPPLEIGTIAIQSQSLFWGYYPQVAGDRPPLVTDDLGYFDTEGYLHLLGRNSQKIITGGENVYPQEVEAALLATGLVQDVVVVGIEDEHWGQVIAAVYVPRILPVTSDYLQECLNKQLLSYKIPKYWLAVKSLPRNSQGKVSYPQLQKKLNKYLKK
jgi:O-succinylbenzoic acid--CoA ligase